MRNSFLTFAGTLLAVALVAVGQLLFHPTLRQPLTGLLPPDLTFPVATGATLLGMLLAAVVLPRRRDAPGLQPHPAPAPLPGVAGLPSAAPAAAPPLTALPRLTLVIALRVLLVIAALVLVYAAQFIFLRQLLPELPEPRALALGSGLLLLGMVAYGNAAMRMDAADAPLEYPAHIAAPLAPDLTHPWYLAWLGVSLACYAFAMGRFDGGGENTAVVAAWLAGIVALLIAQRPPGPGRRWHIAPEQRLYVALLLLVLLVALAMRVYRLTTLPYDLDGDFASHGLQARELATGYQRQIFTFGWANIPMLGFMPSALTMKLFGTGLVGLNAAGILEGLLILVAVFLLGRDLYNVRVGILAAALLAVCYTFLHFSRTSEYIDSVFFMVYAVLFMLWGLRRGWGWAFALSGIFSGIGFQMYYSARVLFFIIGAALLYLLLFRRHWFWARRQGIGLWILAVFIAMGPSFLVFMRNFDAFMERSRDVFLFNPAVLAHLYDKYRVTTTQQVVWEQIKRTLLMFNYYRDTSTQFGLQYPILSPLVGPLFALGVGYALFRINRFSHFIVLAWLALMMVIGCLLTNNAPFWPRLVGVTVPAMLLAAVALERMAEAVARLLAVWGGMAARAAVGLAVAGLIVGIGAANWNIYVEAKGEWAMTRTRIGRYLAAQEPSARAYLVPEPYWFNDREFSFLAPGRFVGNLSEAQVRDGQFSLNAGPTLIVLTPNYRHLLERLEARFPNGTTLTLPDNDPGSIGFYVFAIPTGG